MALATARHNGPAAGPAAKGIDTRLSAAEALIWPLQFLTTQKGPGARAAGVLCFLSAAKNAGSATLVEHQDLRQHDPVRRRSSLGLREDGWESL